MKIPLPVASWTTTLMNLAPGAWSSMPNNWGATCGRVCTTSNPQYHVYPPRTTRNFVTVARSPGNWRTTMGAAGVPVSLLRNPPRSVPPVYLPPRNQIVLPVVTGAGWLNAVCRSHGLVTDPSPRGEPLDDA